MFALLALKIHQSTLIINTCSQGKEQEEVEMAKDEGSVFGESFLSFDGN